VAELRFPEGNGPHRTVGMRPSVTCRGPSVAPAPTCSLRVRVALSGVNLSSSPPRRIKRASAASGGRIERVNMNVSWRAVAPIAVSVAIAIVPPPAGLAPHAWYFFAIFAGVIVALMLEPLPGAAIGLIGVTAATLLAPWVLYSADDLAKPGFKPANAALSWALSGFSNSTVWLIFAAFMFALGYDKTGLGRRISLILVKAMGRRTLTLGYAVTIADLILAPFTPSNTARSGGTIFPVIKNLPPLYQSLPNDPSARRIGGYLMWTAIAATCVTSSMFITALAPNLLALELVKKTAKIDIGWTQWFMAFAPVGILLLILVPLLTYWLYPPEVKEGSEVPAWAGAELEKMGEFTAKEFVLAVLVVLALVMWIFGEAWVNATTVALIVIALMLITGVCTWDDMLSNKPAWNTLAWFATLVALADGLNRVGFVKWFADSVAAQMGGFSPTLAMVVLVAVFFFTHYLFASITAHVTALLPVMLAVGTTIPGMNMPVFSMLLLLTLGIMGILTPYATGPSPVYYGSGYLPTKDYWRLGGIFGVIFVAALLAIGVPYLLLVR
jgi:L-tartrate/succinate antiporter